MVPRGATLVELVVVLVVLGLVSAVAGVALRSPSSERTEPESGDAVTASITAARRDALRSGRAVTVTVRLQGRVLEATALPDGSVIGDAGLGLDRLSGTIVVDSSHGDVRR